MQEVSSFNYRKGEAFIAWWERTKKKLERSFQIINSQQLLNCKKAPVDCKAKKHESFESECLDALLIFPSLDQQSRWENSAHYLSSSSGKCQSPLFVFYYLCSERWHIASKTVSLCQWLYLSFFPSHSSHSFCGREHCLKIYLLLSLPFILHFARDCYEAINFNNRRKKESRSK